LTEPDRLPGKVGQVSNLSRGGAECPENSVKMDASDPAQAKGVSRAGGLSFGKSNVGFSVVRSLELS